MLKLTFPLLLLFAFTFFAEDPISATAGAISPVPTPTPIVTIERIDFDKKVVLIPCPEDPFSSRVKRCGHDENGKILKDNSIVRIQTVLNNSSSVPVLVSYTVSGGRIVGSGTSVYWNFSGVRPGVYELSASVDIGYGASVPKKIAVEVKECEICDMSCACPTINVTSGPEINPGETASFSVEVLGPKYEKLAFEWTITGGSIIDGQGTSNIKVKTSRDQTEQVRATVTISDPSLCNDCRRTSEATVAFKRPK